MKSTGVLSPWSLIVCPPTSVKYHRLPPEALVAVLVLGLVAAADVNADGPSYSFLEVAYAQIEVDAGVVDVDGSGFGLAGSVGIHEDWFLFANYEDASLDFGIDVSLLDAGFGYRHSLSDTMDFNVTASFVGADISTDFGGADDSGYGVGIGVRGMVTDRFELHGGINYIDLGGIAGDDIGIRAGAVYRFTDTFAFEFSTFDFGDDTGVYIAGFRYYFDE